MSSNPKRVSFGDCNSGSMVETLIIDVPRSEKYLEDCYVHKNNNNYCEDHEGVPSQKLLEHNSMHVTFAKDTQPTTVITAQNELRQHEQSLQNGDYTQDSMATTQDPAENLTFSPETAQSSTSVETSTLQSPTLDAKPGPPIIRLVRSPSTESHENPFLADGELAKKAEYIVRHSTISRTEIRISDPDLHKNATVTASPEEVIVSESTPLNAAPPPSTDPKENGQLEKAVKAKPVEAEVGKANASQPEPQQAEQVKLKDNKKCKCCVVQ